MSYSETVTKEDLRNVLNEVLPPVGSTILYNGSKVSSGTITLADAYTNYDFLIVSYFVNVDRYSRVFDCAQISANPTHNFDGDVVSYSGNFSYQSNCSFKPTDITHLAVSNSGNNVNFVAGIVKIVGVTSHDAKTGVAMDYIVEQGTSGNWTYRKWNSGIAECWYYMTGTTDSSGRWHYNPSLPTFLTSTQIIVNATGWSQGYVTTHAGYTKANYASNQWSIDGYLENGSASNSCAVSLSVIGKWK